MDSSRVYLLLGLVLAAVLLLSHGALLTHGQSCSDTYSTTAASLDTPSECWTVGYGESCIYTTVNVPSQQRTMVMKPAQTPQLACLQFDQLNISVAHMILVVWASGMQWCATDGNQVCPTGSELRMSVGKLVSDQNIIGGVSNQRSPWSNRWGSGAGTTCYAAAGSGIVQATTGTEMCLGAFCDTTGFFGGATCNVAVQLQFWCG